MTTVTSLDFCAKQVWGKAFLELLHPQRAHYECIHG